jgi:phosphatidylglycerol---prolipoprotein diacylglyceryl transferase
MYPTVYHFFKATFGVEWELFKIIPMLGLFIGLGFLAANWFGIKELKRREKLGWINVTKKTVLIGKPANPIDLIINGLYGFIIGFKLIPLFTNSEILSDFVSFLLSSRGNLGAGIIVGVVMAYWKYKEVNKDKLETPVEKVVEIRPHEHMGNVTLIGIVGGIGGALIFAFLEQPGILWARFMESGNISDLNGGLTVYGGVILAVFGNIYYFWKNKLPISQYLDALGMTVLLAYGIGRIGCQLAGDGDWGIDNLNPKPDFIAFLPDWMWAFDYPNNINNEGIEIANSIFPEYNHRLENVVYPTPFYETIMSFGLFTILWNLRKKITIPFILFSIYVLFTGLERLLIERIRVNVEYGNGLTQAEIISIILIILGLVGIGYFYQKGRDKKTIESKSV